MKNFQKESQLSFQIKGIELLDIKLNHPKEPLPDPMLFQYKIGVEHKISIENRLIIVITTIDIIHEDQETRLASLQASCIFEIANFEDFLNADTQQISIPDLMIVTLNSVSLSTIRGIMFSQFKGTFLHNAILPVIDPKSFIKNNVDLN